VGGWLKPPNDRERARHGLVEWPLKDGIVNLEENTVVTQIMRNYDIGKV
jgi:hypothetical protein